jgi:CRISPR-associated protein Cmr1
VRLFISKTPFSPQDFNENGIGYNYLGFSFRMTRRKCVPINTQFDLTVKFHPKSTDEDIKKFFCALWLAFNLGNFGSRSRRGFGSVMIEEIDGEFPKDFNLKFKPEDNIAKWLKEQLNYIKGLGFWQERQDIPFVFSENFKIYKVEKENFEKWRDWVEKVQSGRKGKYLKNSWGLNQITNWKELLDFMGFLLMAFRSYRGPDYQNAKDILQRKTSGTNFERPIFGLPLNFYFSSLKNPKGNFGYGDFVNLKLGNETLRRASPLMFKVLEANNYEGFFIVAKSTFIPNNSILVFSDVNVDLPSNEWKALDEFIQSLKKHNIIQEV